MEITTVFGYILFPENIRKAYLIREMDDSPKQNGLVDLLERDGYSVEIVRDIRIVVQGPFYKILLQKLDGDVRTLTGNLKFHAEALNIEQPSEE